MFYICLFQHVCEAGRCLFKIQKLFIFSVLPQACKCNLGCALFHAHFLILKSNGRSLAVLAAIAFYTIGYMFLNSEFAVSQLLTLFADIQQSISHQKCTDATSHAHHRLSFCATWQTTCVCSHSHSICSNLKKTLTAESITVCITIIFVWLFIYHKPRAQCIKNVSQVVQAYHFTILSSALSHKFSTKSFILTHRWNQLFLQPSVWSIPESPPEIWSDIKHLNYFSSVTQKRKWQHPWVSQEERVNIVPHNYNYNYKMFCILPPLSSSHKSENAV